MYLKFEHTFLHSIDKTSNRDSRGRFYGDNRGLIGPPGIREL